MAQAQPSMQELMQQNNAMRAALLATAPKLRKRLQPTTGLTIGQTARIKLQNVGILTGILLRIQCPITIAGAIAVPSLKAPYNLLNRIRVSDYDGSDRVNCSGHQLWVINSVRNRSPFDRNNESMAAVLTQPVVPTAIATNTIDFWVYVPIAFNPDNDLRGAMMMQTAVGDSFLSIDLNPSLYTNNDGDSVYKGAGATTVVQAVGTSITIDVWQDYLLPQAIDKQGNIPLPALDLRTVYEIAGMVVTSDNIAANQQKLMQYPNLRSVVGSYFSFRNGVDLSPVGDVSTIQLIANANNIMRDETELSQLFRQRRYINGDLLQGVYWMQHRDLPIQTALYGNIQIGITPAIINAGENYFEQAFESFYAKGMALPGIPQN